MSDSHPESYITDRHLAKLKQRARVLLLLEAVERTGNSPMPSSKLHAFAYLADVLSPVWGLIPFDGKVYRSEDGPHYPDLQIELDHLVVIGLIQVTNLRYEDAGGSEGGSQITGDYALNFSSEHLEIILDALGAGNQSSAIDPRDSNLHIFLVELAGALATLPDDEIDTAASLDVTYRTQAALHNVVDFAEWAKDDWLANPTWQTAERFRIFLPEQSSLSKGEKLYLYAAYLGRSMNAA